VIWRPRTGEIDIITLRNPLGIVREDFHAYLASYTMRAAYQPYRDIRRLRVSFLS
jgi:hypothetical protein